MTENGAVGAAEGPPSTDHGTEKEPMTRQDVESIVGGSPSAPPPGFVSSDSKGPVPFDEDANSIGRPFALPSADNGSIWESPGLRTEQRAGAEVGGIGQEHSGGELGKTAASAGNSGAYAQGNKEEEEHSNSFSNLAAALGNVLAESMDNATREEKSNALLSDSFFRDGGAASSTGGSRPAAAIKTDQGIPFLNAYPSDGQRPLYDPARAPADYPGDIGGNRQYQERKSAEHPDPFMGAIVQQKPPPSDMGEIPHDGNLLRMTEDLSLTGSEFADSDRHRLAPTSRPFYPASRGAAGPPPNSQNFTARDAHHAKRFGQQQHSDPHSRHRSPARYEDRHYAPNGPPDNGSTSSNNIALARCAEAELLPFMWSAQQHEPSRSLAIIRASSLTPHAIRSVCERSGAVESFRQDFAEIGIFFVQYFDLRSAQHAAMDLQLQLQRMQVGHDFRALVRYCVPLNSSSQHDDSLVVLTDVPSEITTDDLVSVLTLYGPLRTLKKLDYNYGGSSFMVEYFDVIDARQVVLELESTQPWGADVAVEIGTRHPSDRKRGREMISTIGRWRQELARPDIYSNSSVLSSDGGDPSESRAQSPYSARSYRSYNQYDEQKLGGTPDNRHGYPNENFQSRYGDPHFRSDEHHHGSHHDHYDRRSHAGQMPRNSNQNYWRPQQQHYQHNFGSGQSSVVSSQSFTDGYHGRRYPSGSQSVPPYFHADASSVGSHSHLMAMSHPAPAQDEKDTKHLMLNLDAVSKGQDTRTSLMVRNIPNKYTQQMLLSEFKENGHGPGTIDFFYLPIDFKNRCNRGYAFINFVNYQDILEFHRHYFGKHWRTFNSDKICDITYARIQGKSAMLKRFENSALMEKDDEYKPLVFGENGKRLPFGSR